MLAYLFLYLLAGFKNCWNENSSSGWTSCQKRESINKWVETRGTSQSAQPNWLEFGTDNASNTLSSRIKVLKHKARVRAQSPIRPERNSGSCSMKRLGVFLLPLEEMPAHSRVTPRITFAGTQLYTWVESGTMRVKCLSQEHNVGSIPERSPWGHRAFTRRRKMTFIQQWGRIKKVNRTRYSSEKPWSPSICIRSTCLSKSSIGTGWRPRKSTLTGVQRQTNLSLKLWEIFELCHLHINQR